MTLYCWHWKVVQHLSSFIVCLWVKGWFAGLISRRKPLILEFFQVISPRKWTLLRTNQYLLGGLNTKLSEPLHPCLVWIFSEDSLADALVLDTGDNSKSRSVLWQRVGFVTRVAAKTHLTKGLQAARHRYAG